MRKDLYSAGPDVSPADVTLGMGSGAGKGQKYVQRGLASIALARTPMGPADLNLIQAYKKLMILLLSRCIKLLAVPEE